MYRFMYSFIINGLIIIFFINVYNGLVYLKIMIKVFVWKIKVVVLKILMWNNVKYECEIN